MSQIQYKIHKQPYIWFTKFVETKHRIIWKIENRGKRFFDRLSRENLNTEASLTLRALGGGKAWTWPASLYVGPVNPSNWPGLRGDRALKIWCLMYFCNILTNGINNDNKCCRSTKKIQEKTLDRSTLFCVYICAEICFYLLNSFGKSFVKDMTMLGLLMDRIRAVCFGDFTCIIVTPVLTLTYVDTFLFISRNAMRTLQWRHCMHFCL